MRAAWMVGAALAAVAGTANAAELRIEHAAARVMVIPEARGDVQVTVTPGAARLPGLELTRRGGSVIVDGDLRNRIEGCGDTRMFGFGGRTGEPRRPFVEQGGTVTIRGVGRVRVSDLPMITARVPLNVEVSAGGAVFGQVGRTQSLSLSSAGCGDWTVAEVAGPADFAVAGSGDISAAGARQASIRVSGSGDVRLGQVSGPLEAQVSGSGDIRAASALERVSARIAGSGDVSVDGGRYRLVEANIAGSGDVRVAGVIQDVNANIVGSGDVRVGQVLGRVSRHVAGSGDVIVGR